MEWLAKKLAMMGLGGLARTLLMKEGKELGKDTYVTVPDMVIYVLYIVITLILLYFLYRMFRSMSYFFWLLLVRRLGPREAWRVATVTRALTKDK